MLDFLDKIANNDYVLTGLVILLIILVIIFFIVLFCGGKTKNKPVEKINNNDDNNLDNTSSNINFDHDEYVKETTGEFDLTPLREIEPVNDEVSLDTVEESPAYNINSDNNSHEISEMNNFSFDELSKMISEELNKMEINEPQSVETKPEVENNIPEVKFIDTFKEVEEEVKPVEVTKVENIENVFQEKSENDFNKIFVDKKVNLEKTAQIELPKLAGNSGEEIKPNVSNEPLIKDENTPLYARFNQESYELNKED